MPNRDLERDLHERLYDHEEAIDTDELWADLQAELTAAPRRRALWWWLPLGLGALAFACWVGLAQPPHLTQAARTQDAGQVETQAGTSSPKLQPTLPAAPPDQTGTAAARTAKVDDPLPASAESGVFSSVASVAAPAQQPIPPANFSEDIDLTATSPTSSAATLPHPAPRAPSPSATPVAADRLPVAGEKGNAQQLVSAVTAVAPLAILPLTSLPTVNLPAVAPKPVDYRFRVSYRPWSLSVSAGGGKPFRVLNVGDSEEGRTQRARTEAIDRPLEAVTASALLTYRTRGGWFLRSGLSYHRINTVAEDLTETVTTTQDEGVSELIVGTRGDTTVVTGLRNTTQNISRYGKYYNHYTTIDVPLLVGYSLGHQRWRVGLAAGPVLNLLSTASARYQLADGSFSTRTDNAASLRPRLTGISLRADVSLAYQLGPRLSVVAGLSALRRQRSGFEVSNAPVRTSFDVVNLRLGVSRQF